MYLRRKRAFNEMVESVAKNEKKTALPSIQTIISLKSNQSIKMNSLSHITVDPKKLSGKFRRKSCHCTQCGAVSKIEKKFADILPYTNIANQAIVQKKLDNRRNANQAKQLSISLGKSIEIMAQLGSNIK